MHTYLPTYIHTYIPTYIHTYIQTHTYIHTYIQTHIHTDTHTYIHIIHINTDRLHSNDNDNDIASFKHSTSNITPYITNNGIDGIYIYIFIHIQVCILYIYTCKTNNGIKEAMMMNCNDGYIIATESAASGCCFIQPLFCLKPDCVC